MDTRPFRPHAASSNRQGLADDSDSSSLLEARGIGRREASGKNWLFQDIFIRIEWGARLAIVGSTGSGKTLLLRALAHLDAIDVGEILWKGKPIKGDAVPRFRSQAIYLHQRPALFEGTVEENLRLPFTLQCHREGEFSRETILSLLGQVNRTEALLERFASDLSGGEAQIVALLRAIQLRPTLLLLDEPTAALDDESSRMIERLVSGWFEESPAARALVWVSHNKEQVARVASRVMSMSAGRLSDGVEPTQEQLP